MASLTKPKTEEFTQAEIDALLAEAGVSAADAKMSIVDDGDNHTFEVAGPAAKPSPAADEESK